MAVKKLHCQLDSSVSTPTDIVNHYEKFHSKTELALMLAAAQVDLEKMTKERNVLKHSRKFQINCNKIGYPSETVANQNLINIRMQKDIFHMEKRAYKCESCAYWHLTKIEEWHD